MRPSSIIVPLPVALATACQPQPADTTAPPIASPAGTPAATLTLAQRFSPILSGSWVVTDYLETLARTRSPKVAFNEGVPAPASLAITTFATQQDSVEIGASYGLHEGGSLTLLLQPGRQANFLPIRRDYSDENGTFRELGYRITANDTLLIITRRRKNGQFIYQQTYRRTGGPTTTADLEAAVNLGVNQLLLARQYRGTDSLGRPVQAQFALDGTVRGLPFSKYLVITDFTGPNPGDEILFDSRTKRRTNLAASFGRDTLRLYTVHETIYYAQFHPDSSAASVPVDSAYDFKRSRLCYQLVRVKHP